MPRSVLVASLMLALASWFTVPAAAQAPAPPIPPASAPAPTEPAPPPPLTSTYFDDIPAPPGCDFDANASVGIESPRVKAARLVYKGRVELLSLARTLRTSIEAQGWRATAVSASGSKGITQVYEKSGDSLQVELYEKMWNTYVVMTVARVVGGPSAPSR